MGQHPFIPLSANCEAALGARNPRWSGAGAITAPPQLTSSCISSLLEICLNESRQFSFSLEEISHHPPRLSRFSRLRAAFVCQQTPKYKEDLCEIPIMNLKFDKIFELPRTTTTNNNNQPFTNHSTKELLWSNSFCWQRHTQNPTFNLNLPSEPEQPPKRAFTRQYFNLFVR